MLTQAKPSGLSKLGKQEKKLLLLMLRNDEPQGKPTLIWVDVYQEFEIDYSCLPKKYQPKVRKEKTLRQSIRRLTKRGLIKPIVIAQQNTALTDPRGQGYNFYSLTPPGRSVAEKLTQPQTSSKDTNELEKTLNQLRTQNNKYVTTTQIRELLWQNTDQKDTNKPDFEKHWNNTKLGRMLKKYNIERTRVRKNDGRRKYAIGDIVFNKT
ncbi:MAG: hypothetical protein LBH74_07070 [Nitrososphaerota archaeon]|jgi:hypothetical protein|uniref:hypothetical protein n=1 Tax=Candidatus Bathycorpusculum sp. TaxID=2994959 RepID=UPI002822231F|nr:hypothetical protein [Candidatus Termitimicrobium sp.]MCL2432177.1 hypothetical protein [Candidatus Termitimicrobium sp.]MDR0493379.1 hypothetical protein [Nitrososphaerota archaeon]